MQNLIGSTLFLALLLTGPASWAGDERGESLTLDPANTALLITDPQNDFLSEQGAAYGLVKDNLARVGTIDNIGKLFQHAKKRGYAVFVSPHHYFPHDGGWGHRGALQKTIHDIGMFRISKPITSPDFKDSGADFLQRYKSFINDGKTVIASPHKVYGPESNDLVLQLRKRGIQTVVVGGMAANLCTDSHMRELVEQGFEVLMVSDAVGAPGEEAYQAAMVNYQLIANAVLSTAEVIAVLK